LLVIQDFLISGPDKSNAFLFEFCLTKLIIFLIHFTIINATIKLDCQTTLMAIEVHHKALDHMLAAKLKAMDLPIPQQSPSFLLSGGLILPQLSREVSFSFCHPHWKPSPRIIVNYYSIVHCPSPRGRGATPTFQPTSIYQGLTLFLAKPLYYYKYQ
jgi:hypothetical protein